MQASNSQADELPARSTNAKAQSTCNVPSWFKDLPVELQDMVLEHVLCDFRRPGTSDPANNGIYIGEHRELARMRWRIDTAILEHPDEDIKRRARRVMLVTNQLVYIKSESANLLPIFHAAQVPTVTLSTRESTRHRIVELSKYFFITHEIERIGGLKSSMTSTGKPWGQTRLSLLELGLTGHGVNGLQEFVILRRDLALFCRALDGAHGGYYQFGACTWHGLTFHRPLHDLLKEDIPAVSPASFSRTYRETLRGFTAFAVQGRIEHSLAEATEIEVGIQTATPRPNDVIETLNRQMSRGDKQLRLDMPTRAAHIYARAAQELIVLYSKGTLPRMADSTPLPELAEIFFVLKQRQVKAWLAVMEESYEAARGSTTRDGRGDQPEERRTYREKMLSLKELVRSASTLGALIPPPLKHKATPHQTAIQLCHLVMADRLSDSGSRSTRENILLALRLYPEDEDIRGEAELVKRRFQPWTLRWIPE